MRLPRLRIPDSEKARGMLWAEYPVCTWEPWWQWFPALFIENWEPWGIAELEIRNGEN